MSPGHGYHRLVAAPVQPPERHPLLLEALLQSEVGLGLWDRAPVPHLADPRRSGARGRGSVAPGDVLGGGSFGSLSAMLEWTFKVTSMPWDRAHCRNELGSGNSELFHSHPSQLLGAFQSVSSDSVLRGTWFCWKAG